MAKKKYTPKPKPETVRNGIVTKTPETATTVVVQELRIVAPDREQKDIGEFHTAMRTAEAIYVPNRARLYDLYTDISLDGHLSGTIRKRIDSVLNKGLYFEDAEGKRVDEMDDLIRSMVFRDIITIIMETPAWGISGMEFIPGQDLAFEEIPRKHIRPEKKLIAFDQYGGEDGVSYDGVSNLWVIGKTRDLGYMLKCAPYAIWKRGNLADWAQYIEIFGQPVRIIQYDGYDQKTKMELQTVLDKAGSSLALMIPKQANFSMMDGKTSNGDGQLQDKFRDACNNEMSIIVLGNTETTQSSKSSGYAQSKEHGKQQLEITKSDMEYVKNTLHSKEFFTILKSYGFAVDGGKFCYEKEIDVDALKTRMEVDTFVSTKVPIDDDYWYDTYGISKPDNYEELKAKMDAEKAASTGAIVNEDDVPALPTTIPGKRPKPVIQPDNPIATGANVKKKLSAWQNIRAQLADFFDLAP